MKAAAPNNFDHKRISALLKVDHTLAIELIYDQFSSILFGVASKLVKSESEAEDLLMETLLRICKDYSSLDESKQNIYLWAIGILRLVASEKLQLVTNMQNQKAPFYVDTDMDIVRSENSSLFHSEDGDGVLKSSNQKNILDMIFFNGNKITDVAKYLGMDENKIKKILHEEVNIHRKESEMASWK